MPNFEDLSEKSSDLNWKRFQFANVLNIKLRVTNISVIESTFFSDQGAWFAFALPNSKDDFGSFIGPLLMAMDGKWLANSIAKLAIVENGQAIDFSAGNVEIHYFPGLLQQRFITNELHILSELIFVSNKEALIQTSFTNNSTIKRNLIIQWDGEVLLTSASLNKLANGLQINFTDNTFHYFIIYHETQMLNLTVTDHKYCAKYETTTLKPNQTFSTQQVHSYFPSDTTIPPKANFNYQTELSKNSSRWESYIINYFSSSRITDTTIQRLAVKCIMTLITNWRSAAGDLFRDGLFPSSSYQGFYGLWSWDSWKQVAGLSHFNIELAKSNILSMFDYQNEEGMVPDCIYLDKSENNWRNTKAPLAAWAVCKMFENDGDISFVKELYPKLVKYHNWWYAYRDHDENHLCEYGSTDGTCLAAKWESGMDNAARFDDVTMVRNSEHAWSMDRESVDLNSYLHAEKLYLAFLAQELGKFEDAERFAKDAKELKIKINEAFYNKENGFYYDRNAKVGPEGPEGWIPLWAGIPDESQTRRVVQVMSDERKFNTFLPLPTLSVDSPEFDPENGYWRGPVWLDQLYFGMEGLLKYSYRDLCEEFRNRLLQNAQGLLTDEPIRENYHPLTGEGLNARNFSWSAAHLLMILKL